MSIVSTKFLFLLGLYWMSKVGVTLGHSRECWAPAPPAPGPYGDSDSVVHGWRCNSGQCVEMGYLCDGSSHCLDGEDESPATCCASTCPSDPDICIPAGQEIEPDQDCRDCTTEFSNPGWRCNSGQCVEMGYFCDGSPDCSDGEDESPATCCASTCPSNPDICIPAGQEIEPDQDCRDCTLRYGDPGWRCNSGKCLWKWEVCDGKPDCSDGEDESPTTCCASTCPSDPDICIQAGQEILPGQDCRECTDRYGDGGWRCNSGQCLPSSYVCTGGDPNCQDGSDESPSACCPSTCPNDSDICIPAGQEVLPGQDCRECTAINPHLVGLSWRCNSGECVWKGNMCDGSPQCSDGSDESHATCPSWFTKIFG